MGCFRAHLGALSGWQRWGAGGAAGGPGRLREAKGFGALCFTELRATGDPNIN